MTIEKIAEQVARWTDRLADGATPIPWFSIYRHVQATLPCPSIYEPSVAMIVQGRKQIVVNDEVLTYGPDHFLLTSIDLPVVSHIVEASPDRPYLSMRVKLDLATVREMILAYELPAPRVAPIRRGITTGTMTEELRCAFWRLLDLLDEPDDARVVSDLVMREIIYYLLKSEQGTRLWDLAMTNGQSYRIQKVISWLRHHYTEPLRVEDLAAIAAMSPSSMHQHFRETTSMSPLQYQKQLRLQEARRLMLVEDVDAGSAAVRVGYESASQFSREYARMFGQPPMRDIKGLRAAAAV